MRSVRFFGLPNKLQQTFVGTPAPEQHRKAVTNILFQASSLIRNAFFTSCVMGLEDNEKDYIGLQRQEMAGQLRAQKIEYIPCLSQLDVFLDSEAGMQTQEGLRHLSINARPYKNDVYSLSWDQNLKSNKNIQKSIQLAIYMRIGIECAKSPLLLPAPGTASTQACT